MMHINHDTKHITRLAVILFFSIFNPFVMLIYLTVTAKNKACILRKFHFAPDIAVVSGSVVVKALRY